MIQNITSRIMNSSKYLRELFMKFFISRSHLKIPSGPVIVKHNLYNQSDFTCAGVQQVNFLYKSSKILCVFTCILAI